MSSRRAKSLGLAIRQAAWLGKGPAPVTVVPAEEDATESVSTSPPPALPADEGATKSVATSSKAPPLVAPLPPDKAPASSPDEEPGQRKTDNGKPVAASPLPAPPPPAVEAEIKPEEIVIPIGDRRYRVRGLAKNLSYDVLKVNLFASRGEGYHVDTFDLYSARHRASFQKVAALELGVKDDVVKKDLGKVLLKLEELQDQQIQAALEPAAEPSVTLSDEERETALALLRDPRLLDRILEDFDRCGIVGEETNKLVGYLAAVSRKTDDPLAVIIQSSSAAGKTSLMEAILAFMPEEERIKYSAMTGQSLFYMGETNLKHKILAIVEEEGAERASYALKLLQSEHELSIASTGKDPQTGKLVTHEYRVEGPVMIFLTTTAVDLDEELQNRCLVLTVDESREQTRAIHRLQRERRTLEGLRRSSARGAVLQLHRNAQRLLQPLAVRNRFARELTFLDTQTRTRRDHEKYLTLIDSIALLHQHQRTVERFRGVAGDVAFVDVELEDVEVANRLAAVALGRTLDELPPQTRRLLLELDAMVSRVCAEDEIDRASFRFTRRWVREGSGWGDTQLKVHLARLVDYEFLGLHRGMHAQRLVYELLFDGQGREGERFFPGLLDVETLRRSAGNGARSTENRSGSDPNRSGQNGNRSAPGRPPVGGWSGGTPTGFIPLVSSTSVPNRSLSVQNAHLDLQKNGPVDPTVVPSTVADQVLEDAPMEASDPATDP